MCPTAPDTLHSPRVTLRSHVKVWLLVDRWSTVASPSAPVAQGLTISGMRSRRGCGCDVAGSCTVVRELRSDDAPVSVDAGADGHGLPGYGGPVSRVSWHAV